MRYYFIIILCLGLNACAKKKFVKPEAAPPPKMYIEKFHHGEEPEQWGMFTNGQEPSPTGKELKKMLEY